MLNFILARWQAIKTKFKKFFSFLLTFLFCVSPLSASAVEFDAYNGYSVYWSNLTSNTTELNVTSYINGAYTSYFQGVTTYSNGIHHVSNNAISGLTSVSIGSSGDEFYFPYNPQNYKYYLVGVIQSVGFSDWTPERLQLTVKRTDGSNNYFGYYFNRESNVLVPNNQSNLRGFSFSVPIDFSSIDSSGIQTITLISSSASSIGNNINFACSVVEIPVDSSAESTSSIIAAIQNQTSILGGKIDDTNDLIYNGNDGTGGIVSQFQSNLNEFNSVINEFNDIENGFLTDFNNANDTVTDSLLDMTFTGNLLSCANWVTDKYMDFFNVSGDFKQYFIYPLLIGIVLFFIGRGGVILGNLYRKPYDSSTHTVSTGYTVKYDDGTKRSETYTRTTGKGGKLRK